MGFPVTGDGENKENVCKKLCKESDVKNHREESSGSSEMNSSVVTEDSASSMEDTKKDDEDYSTPLEIGQHYLIRRNDGQWCTCRNNYVVIGVAFLNGNDFEVFFNLFLV